MTAARPTCGADHARRINWTDYGIWDDRDLPTNWVHVVSIDSSGGYDEPLPPLPWNSDDLSRAVGVDPDRFRRHEAMADAGWARAIYDRVMDAA